MGKPKNKQNQCKDHPKHVQCPGVCSMCLREKLSSLFTSSPTTSVDDADQICCSSSSSVSSYYYSSSSSSSSQSSCSSPAPEHHQSSLSTFLFSGIGIKKKKNTGVITKSRSMGFEKVFISHDGFWSKLLRSRNKCGGPRRPVALTEMLAVTA